MKYKIKIQHLNTISNLISNRRNETNTDSQTSGSSKQELQAGNKIEKFSDQ